MNASEKVTAYIQKHKKWSTHLSQLRKLLLDTELTEEVKWGAPSYSLDGKLVIGMAAFKNHMGIWFHQGVFLKDPYQQLFNAQEGKTKALRQWRFKEDDSINEPRVSQYINEAIANCRAGKEIKPKKSTTQVTIPPMLLHAIKENTELEKAFTSLTPGKQREYSEYIATAKRDTTKLSRLEKIKPLIIQGKGLNDKYKNC